MSKYILTFEKKGYIKYISHLDVLRLFQRVFRRSGIKLSYSQGFNPHPKMSFALPLSLGYTGLAELLEIETAIDYECDDIRNKVNEIMPEGISITTVERTYGKRNAGSYVNAGEYIIKLSTDVDDNTDYKALAEEFMNKQEIIEQKLQRKTGKILDIDIRPLIKEMSVNVVDNNIIMKTTIAQGSQETLSPEILVKSFMKFAGKEIDLTDVDFTRKSIIWTKPDESPASGE